MIYYYPASGEDIILPPRLFRFRKATATRNPANTNADPAMTNGRELLHSHLVAPDGDVHPVSHAVHLSMDEAPALREYVLFAQGCGGIAASEQ